METETEVVILHTVSLVSKEPDLGTQSVFSQSLHGTNTVT